MGLFKEELVRVKAFVFDVDGVLAESRVVLHPSGDLMRTMNTKDGYAMAKAVQSGFPVGIISGAKSPSIKDRFFGLGITDIFLDSQDKGNDLDEFIRRHQISDRDVLYMGDDIPDLVPLKRVGMPTCPHDAVEEVQSVSKYISGQNGGNGCVRDIVEQVLRAQGMWTE